MNINDMILSSAIFMLLSFVTLKIASGKKPVKQINEKASLPFYKQVYSGPCDKLIKVVKNDLISYAETIPSNYRSNTKFKFSVESPAGLSELRLLGWTWKGHDREFSFSEVINIDNVRIIDLAGDLDGYLKTTLFKAICYNSIQVKITVESRIINLPKSTESIDDEAALIAAKMEIDSDFSEALNRNGIFLKKED